MANKRVFLIVLDSFGIGEAPDAADYGDAGSNTLLAISKSKEFYVPNLKRLGLFNIDGTLGGESVEKPTGSFGRMQEKSIGKDTTVGHWEIAGVVTEKAFPTYPNGFSDKLMQELAKALGRGVLCGMPYSGTSVIADYGQEHIETGKLIAYTSADSVLQIAAHEDIVPLEELYEICEKARTFMQGENAVARIIARPFAGTAPAGTAPEGATPFIRTAGRHDFALPPPQDTMLDILAKSKVDVISVGKINDIFAGKGVTRKVPSKNNTEGMEKTIELAKENFCGLCFVNLVDFDMLYGHRNDADGYAKAMAEFDLQLAQMQKVLRPEDIVMITADHGCDPSTQSTDHSREYTPCIILGDNILSGVNLGTRNTMADIGQTVLDYFGLAMNGYGKSFLGDIKKS